MNEDVDWIYGAIEYPLTKYATIKYATGDKVWLLAGSKKLKAVVSSFDLPSMYGVWAVPVVLEKSGVINIAHANQIARRK